MYKLVLLRHGESVWNKANRFTGWYDVDLNETGVQQAKMAGQLLREQNFDFDMTYTSVLVRAVRTHWLALEEMGTINMQFSLWKRVSNLVPNFIFQG